MHFRKATADDHERIKILYQEVAKRSGGIARTPEEVTDEYIDGFLEKSIGGGLIFVIEHPEKPRQLIGEIHAYKSGLLVFDNTIGSLTLAIHPDFQGKKLGYKIFRTFLDEILGHRPDILRVELWVRESNIRGQRLYESLGFKVEGRMEKRIRNADGSYEADIPMGWLNPKFAVDGPRSAVHGQQTTDNSK
jgi:ribosomal protein S18 acetylase RimI-like enzyme